MALAFWRKNAILLVQVLVKAVGVKLFKVFRTVSVTACS
jgi:hypothetical protein